MPSDDSLSSKSTPKHVAALDGVRGVAIILVLVYHLTHSSNPHTQSIFLNGAIAFCTFGWIGVDLFFVLSGFLITGILYDTLNSSSYFLNFYARRFLRIFPLYYGSLVALFLLSGLLSIHWGLSPLLLLAYLQNIPGLHKFVTGSVFHYTSHFWSLAIEEQFYLVWPCIVFITRDRKKLMYLALIIATIAPILRISVLLMPELNHEIWCYRFTLCRIDGLLVGGTLALALRGPEKSRIFKFAPAVFLVLFSFCVGFDAWLTRGILDVHRGKFFYSVGFTLLAISFSALIAWTVEPGSLAARALQNACLRWFGRYSYGIYVLHMIFANVYIVGEYPRIFLNERFHSKLLGVALGGVPTLVTTLLCAWLSFRFYETPFLRLKRYFGRPSEPGQMKVHRTQFS